MSNIQFQGIVAVGSSLPQAVSRYRLLAMGKGVEGFVDKANNVAFISNASADTDKMFNPANGNMDLEQNHEVLSGLQFEAKAGDVHEAYHFHCESGCGSHVMFDSETYVKNCPVCATSLSATADEDEDSELSDEELDDLEVTDEDEDDLEDEDLEEGDSDEELEEDEEDSELSDEEEEEEEPADEELDEEEEESEEDSEDDSDDEEELDDEELDDEEEEELDDVDEDAPLVIAASTRDEAISQYTRIRSGSMKATASDVRTVDYKVCASDDGCGAHIVSELALERCPKNGCNSLLQEPGQTQAAIASASNADEDGEEEEVSMSVLDDENTAEAHADEGSPEPATPTAPVTPPAQEPSAPEAPTPTDNDGADAQPEKSPEGMEPAEGDQTSESSEEDEDEEEEGDEITVDALEDLDDDASADDIDLSLNQAVAGQRTWTAYHKGVPIATATAATVRPDHREFVGEQRFGTATAAAIKIGGAKKMLIEMGFKGVKHSLNVPKHVEQRAAALATAAEEQMQQEQEQYHERLQAAMATALVGITRGSFKGESNPVREALCNTLSAAGVRSPEIVVDNALRGAFEPFLRQAMARAADIMSKPIEVQQSLAQTIMDMSYMPQTATASSNVLESRLGSLGTVTASADVAPAAQPEKADTAVVTAGSDDFNARLQSVVGKLGRR